MTAVYFNNENLVYDFSNEHFHSYELDKINIVPNVGDIVDFEDDSYFETEKILANGSKFIVTRKTIRFSRMKGCKDDFYIDLLIEPYLE